MSKTSNSPISRSRRDFLKLSAAATAGGLAISRGAHAAGSDVLKIGLIGSGSRGSGAAVNAMNADPSVRLVAMGDLFMDRIKASRESLRNEKKDQVAVDDDHCFAGFDSYQKVIASGADLILIACASKFHPMYAMAAIQAGKHVFCEKPHGIDPPGVRLVLEGAELAKKKGLCYASGLCSRYHVGLREATKRIRDGMIGDLLAIEVNYLRSPYQIIDPKSEWSELQYQLRNWYHFVWLSGDDVAQSLVHNIDRAAMINGEQVPVKCRGLGGRSTSVGRRFGDMFDHHAIVYEYASGLRMYGNNQTRFGCYSGLSDIAIGTKGTYQFQFPPHFTIRDRKGKVLWKNSAAVNFFDQEHKEIFQAIKSGKPINDGEHAAHSTLTCIMGQIACYSGREVTWEEISKSNFNWGPKPEEVSFHIDAPVKPGEDGNYPIPIPGVTKYQL